jgi:hypothetical protein
MDEWVAYDGSVVHDLGREMWWPGEKKRLKLWSEGAQTEGVVVKVWWYADPIQHYGIVFRVKFPDGSSTDVKKRVLYVSDVGTISEGDSVPVRYDPSDYSKVVLDEPALEAPVKAAKAAQGARVDAALAHLGEPGSGTSDEAGVQTISGLADTGDVRAQLLRIAAENPGSVINLSSGSPGQSSANPEDRLAKLAALKEKGLLSDDEFTAAKAKILGED